MRKTDSIYSETYKSAESNSVQSGSSTWQPKLAGTVNLPQGEYLLFYSCELISSQARVKVDGQVVGNMSSANFWVAQSGIKSLVLGGSVEFSLEFLQGQIRNARLYLNKIDF